jgi:hypothetical protein
LCFQYEAVNLTWIVLIFVSNLKSAFHFYRTSADPSHQPPNKLLAGLQDSACAWAALLPVYWASAYYECAQRCAAGKCA